MKSFKVEVTRVSYGFTTLDVVAESEREAKRIAIEQAGDVLFSTKSADYIAEIINDQSE